VRIAGEGSNGIRLWKIEIRLDDWHFWTFFNMEMIEEGEHALNGVLFEFGIAIDGWIRHGTSLESSFYFSSWL
jgi:hypothetical protein